MAAPKMPIEPSTIAEIVHNLKEKLSAYYVFPDIAGEICALLQKNLDAGEFDEITTGEELALALTLHIQGANQDKHLGVRWYPDPLPEHDGPMHLSQEMMDEWRQQAAFDNYGLHKAERLPGNVGYLDIRAFSRAVWGGDTAAAAMTFLASTSVLIIDLRQCRGGDPDMVALITTYLMGEEKVHLNSLYWREDDETNQYWTLPYVPGKRFGDKPVYVLTSKDTFSGGEEFAYNLKTRQRATLVGETTGGGAHPGSTYRLHPHFEVFIPNGRAINPVTGTNWEGSGVAPDIPVSQGQALNTAYKAALENILKSLKDETSRPFSLLKEEAQTTLKELQDKEGID